MTTSVKTTTYTQCEQCGFWHAPDEPHCANCGVSFLKEYETVINEELVQEFVQEYMDKFKGIGTVVGVIVGSIIGIVSVGIISKDFNFGGAVGVGGGLVGAPFGFLVGLLSAKVIGHKKAAKQVLKPAKIVAVGLLQNEKLINQRLNEIEKKDHDIQKLMQELKQQGNPERNRYRFQTLEKGLAELPRKRERYAEKLREIELIRWINQLSPFLSYSRQLTEQQVTERLELLNELQTQGQQLAQEWELALLTDNSDCIERLRQALASCEQLRRNLFDLKTALVEDKLDLKTALVVGDISLIDKEEQSISEAALELQDMFNAMPDVGGFTAGFKKLEDEYFRLQSEDEVRQMTK